jgi:putative iron-dependent peroxidase
VTGEMLVNMFIGRPPGNTDRILDFSAAVTGCLFFAPCADFLDNPPGPPRAASTTATDAAVSVLSDVSVAPADAPMPGDGSLGIGSLKG